MNYIILFIILMGVLTPSAAFAQSTTSGQTRPTLRAERQTTRMQLNRTGADTEITRRIDALNKLVTKINDMKKLSTDQKSQYAAKIQTEITNLTALKAKIDADTDPATLKTDKQSIVTAYRVFALYIPQINLLTATDRLLTTVDNLSALATKLQTRIQEAQTNGKDVTSLQTSLTDMQNKIADAKTQAQNAQTSVLALTPDGYPGNKTTLQSTKTLVKTAETDLKTAVTDAKTIAQSLRGMIKTSLTPSPSTTTP